MMAYVLGHQAWPRDSLVVVVVEQEAHHLPEVV